MATTFTYTITTVLDGDDDGRDAWDQWIDLLTQPRFVENSTTVKEMDDSDKTYTKALSQASKYIYDHSVELMEEGRYEDPADAVQHAWEAWDDHCRNWNDSEDEDGLKAELLNQMKPEQQALQFVKQIADLDFEGDFASAQEARSVAVMLLGLIEQARAIVAGIKS